MENVFISYSRKDRDFVRRLSSDIQETQHSVWVDVSEITGGDSWKTEISNAINSADYFIVVLSPSAIDSEWVRNEFLLAQRLGKKIIPLYYKSCELPLIFQSLQVIDVQEKNYEKNLPKILEALNASKEIYTKPIKTVRKREQPLFEVKLLVVGQGGVGKSSLLRRLTSEEFEIREGKTEGISISTWAQ